MRSTFCQAPVVVIGDVLLLCACDGVMVLQQRHCQLQCPRAQLCIVHTRLSSSHTCMSALHMSASRAEASLDDSELVLANRSCLRNLDAWGDGTYMEEAQTACRNS